MSPRRRRRPRDAQEAFAALIEDDLSPLLVDFGFRRVGNTFHRGVGANWEVVNVQKSRSSSLRVVTFTVNLGVGWAGLREGTLTWPDGQRPALTQCHFADRLGTVAEGRDVWYDLTRWTNTHKLATRVAGVLEESGLPWLDGRSSSEEALALAGSDAVMKRLPVPQLAPFVRVADLLGETALSDRLHALIVAKDASSA